MHGPILEARNVGKTYRSGDRLIPILAGVDLAMHAGESVSVCGASGAGKSTLLNLLAGLDQPDSGEIRWDGKPIAGSGVAGPALHRRTFLGMIFQSFHLVPELDVRENVLLAARIAGTDGRAARQRATALLQQIGLADRADHLPSQLSAGSASGWRSHGLC